MEEKKLVPKLRFPGFTEPWEQRKLGDMGKTFNGLAGKTKEDFGHGAAQYVTYLNVFQNTMSDLSMTEKIEIDKSQNEVQYGDILFTTSSETPEEVGMSSVWLGKMLNTYLNSFCFGYRPMVDIDHHFIGNLLRSSYVRNKMKILAQGISRYNISKNKVMDLEIALPSKEEQKLIGSVLNYTDNLITLHQRKLEHLKLKKKSLLQKLFPKEGEVYPEFRFPGFTDPWEQRKLGEEAIEILAGGDIEKEKVVYDSGYPIYANALTNDGLVGYYTDYYRVEAPAVTVTGRGEVGHAQARSQNFTPIVRLLAIRSKHDCYFLENAINNYKTIVESTGVPQLTVPQLSAYKLCFPLNIEEEKRISICFQNLDTLITLHQRKLEHLQLLKKALLQQLFV